MLTSACDNNSIFPKCHFHFRIITNYYTTKKIYRTIKNSMDWYLKIRCKLEKKKIQPLKTRITINPPSCHWITAIIRKKWVGSFSSPRLIYLWEIYIIFCQYQFVPDLNFWDRINLISIRIPGIWSIPPCDWNFLFLLCIFDSYLADIDRFLAVFIL